MKKQEKKSIRNFKDESKNKFRGTSAKIVGGTTDGDVKPADKR